VVIREAVVEMAKVRVHNFSISLDGFGTGEGLSLEHPFGHAGHRLHEWMFATTFGQSMLGGDGGSLGVDQAFAERNVAGVGAEIMGAGKFGPPGWQSDPDWNGWWGDEPPFHSDVFVMTHQVRPSLELSGGTTFHFVQGSPVEVLDRARAVAGDLDVRVGGGVSTVRAFFAADLIDLAHIVQVPILLGRGVRLWDGLEGLDTRFSREAVSSPSGVTHLTFTRVPS
jgi:dihydrofolate reductase